MDSSVRNLATAEARIRQVLRSKNIGAPGYWQSRGKERFARELAADGVSANDAAVLLDLIDAELFPTITLDQVLRDMKERAARAG